MKRLLVSGMLLLGVCHPGFAQPAAIEDLRLTVPGPTSVVLEWSPIGQDIIGNPLNCVRYSIYSSPDPYADDASFTLLGTTTETSYLSSTTAGRLFYRVKSQSCEIETPTDMLRVPAGTFMRGEPSWPDHETTLTHDFFLGRTELSNQQYLTALNWAYLNGLVTVVGNYAVQYGQNLLAINGTMDVYEIRFNQGTNQFELHAATHSSNGFGPGGGYDPSLHPVKNVTWYGAACFCDWRSQMENLVPYYQGQWSACPVPNNPYTAAGYRLPTHAEWEYAAQYPDDRLYSWGATAPNCSYANYTPNWVRCTNWASPPGSHPLGDSFLGFQHMSGNMWEYCNDRYGATPGPSTDPVGPSDEWGWDRIFAGGDWLNSNYWHIQCSAYNHGAAYNTWVNKGFRLCRSAN